jgi:hypothetical protein
LMDVNVDSLKSRIPQSGRGIPIVTMMIGAREMSPLVGGREL